MAVYWVGGQVKFEVVIEHTLSLPTNEVFNSQRQLNEWAKNELIDGAVYTMAEIFEGSSTEDIMGDEDIKITVKINSIEER